MVNFKTTIVAAGPSEDFPDSRVLNILDALHIFDKGIHDPMFVFKKRGKISAADIAIFINRGG
jgi:hypothetical protein